MFRFDEVERTRSRALRMLLVEDLFPDIAGVWWPLLKHFAMAVQESCDVYWWNYPYDLLDGEGRYRVWHNENVDVKMLHVDPEGDPPPACDEGLNPAEDEPEFRTIDYFLLDNHFGTGSSAGPGGRHFNNSEAGTEFRQYVAQHLQISQEDDRFIFRSTYPLPMGETLRGTAASKVDTVHPHPLFANLAKMLRRYDREFPSVVGRIVVWVQPGGRDDINRAIEGMLREENYSEDLFFLQQSQSLRGLPARSVRLARAMLFVFDMIDKSHFRKVLQLAEATSVPAIVIARQQVGIDNPREALQHGVLLRALPESSETVKEDLHEIRLCLRALLDCPTMAGPAPNSPSRGTIVAALLAAQRRDDILITGEPGTGKRTLASLIKSLSFSDPHWRPRTDPQYVLPTSTVTAQDRPALPDGQVVKVSLSEDKTLVVSSSVLRNLYNLIIRVAPNDDKVLLQGETGVGKELFARLIHDTSGRNGRIFPVNCAELNAMDSAWQVSFLFGSRERGRTCQGLLDHAQNGTVYFDEVHLLKPDTQGLLLRAVEYGRYRPLGQPTQEGEELQTNARFVFATNRNPDEVVKEGGMKYDFLSRIKAIHISIPPIRDRREDVVPLFNHFLGDRMPHARLTVNAARVLEAWDWPDNARGVWDVVKGLLLDNNAREVTIADLPDALVRHVYFHGSTVNPNVKGTDEVRELGSGDASVRQASRTISTCVASAQENLHVSSGAKQIDLLPLSKRPEDIPNLIEYFLRARPDCPDEKERGSRVFLGIDEPAIESLSAMPWDDNVTGLFRRLEQLAERAWNKGGPTGEINAEMLTSAAIPAASATIVSDEQASSPTRPASKTKDILKLAAHGEKEHLAVVELVHFLVTGEFSQHQGAFPQGCGPLPGLCRICLERRPGQCTICGRKRSGQCNTDRMRDAFAWLCLRPARNAELTVKVLTAKLKLAADAELNKKWSSAFKINTYRGHPYFSQWADKVERAFSDAQAKALATWQEREL